MAGNFFTAVRRGMCVALLAGSLGACAGGLGGNKEAPLDELPPEEIYKRGELTLETARKPGDSGGAASGAGRIAASCCCSVV